MNRSTWALPLLTGLVATAWSQTATALTPVGDLGLRQVTVGVPARYAGTIRTHLKVNLPPGFQADIFYKGSLSKPRFMAFGPDSVLFVANQSSGTVMALPDRDRDGAADTAIVAATGLSGVHDVKFHGGALYATTSTRVFKLLDGNGDLVYETRSVFIDSVAALAANPTGGHTTRTLMFDHANSGVYLSIGSSCNACRDAGRGVVERYDMEGRNRRIYATGVRNAVGLALHPVTGRLWANNNGNDNQGDNVPPEWFDLIRDGGFYGWPFAYGWGTYNNFSVSGYSSILPITANDSALVRSMVKPAALIQAHSAPLGLDFATPAFPEKYRNGMFSALHGSWNRSVPTGYKVVFLALSSPQDTTVDSVMNFLTGLTTDSVANSEWARPAGVLADLRGNLFVTSDADSQFVLRIRQETPVSVNGPLRKAATRLERVGSRSFRIHSRDGKPFTLRLRDLQGRTLLAVRSTADEMVWDPPENLTGVHWIQVIQNDGRSEALRMQWLD